MHGLRGLAKQQGELPATIQVVWNGGSAVVGRAQFNALERVEQVTDHRCADGWSAIVHWGGVRVCDVLRSCCAPDGMAIAAETPDGRYRIVLDADVAHHPQTLLVDELGGRPLDPDHGAPWRLVVPTRHARFSLKRVGSLRLGV